MTTRDQAEGSMRREEIEMKGSDRSQRPEPLRQSPNRQPAGGKTVEEVVNEAVRKGYEVVEENLRQGRQAAQRLRLGTYESSEIRAELGKFGNRLLQLGMEFGTTWVQMIAAVLRDPQLRFAFEEAAQEVPQTAATVQPVSPPITYRIRGSRVVEHSLTLHPLRRPTVSAVSGLYSTDGKDSIPPGSVTFKREDNTLVVDINVPNNTPAGTYVGAVVDRDTHDAIGTLRLQIAG
jgi:hypothetical protein